MLLCRIPNAANHKTYPVPTSSELSLKPVENAAIIAEDTHESRGRNVSVQIGCDYKDFLDGTQIFWSE